MATWFLPLNQGESSVEVTPGDRITTTPNGQPRRIWDTPERCEGWRWPAHLAEVEPLNGAAHFWSPHTGEATELTIISIKDGMPLWGPNGRAVLTLAKRVGATSDEQAAAIAGAWLRIPTPARRAALGALWKTTEKASRKGASVAARALGVDAFEAEQHHLGRRVAEPARAAIRAAMSCVVVRDVVKDARSGLTQKGFDLLTSPWQA